jgi:hypothetical protein
MVGETDSQMEKSEKIYRSIYKIFVNFSHKKYLWGSKKIFFKEVENVFFEHPVLVTHLYALYLRQK